MLVEVVMLVIIFLRVVCRNLAMMPVLILALSQLIVKPSWGTGVFLAEIILFEALIRRLGLFAESVSNLTDLVRTFQTLKNSGNNLQIENQQTTGLTNIKTASLSTAEELESKCWHLKSVNPKIILYDTAQEELQRKRRFFSSGFGLRIFSISNGFGGKLAAYRVLLSEGDREEFVSIVLCPYKEEEILRKPMMKQLLLNHEAGHTDFKMFIWSVAHKVYKKSRILFFILVYWLRRKLKLKREA